MIAIPCFAQHASRGGEPVGVCHTYVFLKQAERQSCDGLERLSLALISLMLAEGPTDGDWMNKWMCEQRTPNKWSVHCLQLLRPKLHYFSLTQKQSQKKLHSIYQHVVDLLQTWFIVYFSTTDRFLKTSNPMGFIGFCVFVKVTFGAFMSFKLLEWAML